MNRIAAICMLMVLSLIETAAAAGRPASFAERDGQSASMDNSFGSASAGLPSGDQQLVDLSSPLLSVANRVVVNIETDGDSSAPSNGSADRLQVGGNGTGAPAGGQAGILQAAPLPEADIWSMLLAGTGLVALRMRSRNRAIREIHH